MEEGSRAASKGELESDFIRGHIQHEQKSQVSLLLSRLERGEEALWESGTDWRHKKT